MEHIKLFAVTHSEARPKSISPNPNHYLLCNERDYTCYTLKAILTEDDGYQCEQEFDIGWWAKDGECPLTALKTLYITFKDVNAKVFGGSWMGANRDDSELHREIYKVFNPSALVIPSDYDLAVARIEDIKYKVRKYSELFEAVDIDKTLVNLLFSDNFEMFIK